MKSTTFVFLKGSVYRFMFKNHFATGTTTYAWIKRSFCTGSETLGTCIVSLRTCIVSLGTCILSLGTCILSLKTCILSLGTCTAMLGKCIEVFDSNA